MFIYHYTQGLKLCELFTQGWWEKDRVVGGVGGRVIII